MFYKIVILLMILLVSCTVDPTPTPTPTLEVTDEPTPTLEVTDESIPTLEVPATVTPITIPTGSPVPVPATVTPITIPTGSPVPVPATVTPITAPTGIPVPVTMTATSIIIPPPTYDPTSTPIIIPPPTSVTPAISPTSIFMTDRPIPTRVTPTPTSYTPLIQSFWLVDANRDVIVAEVSTGMIVNLFDYAIESMSIVVLTSPPIVGSVEFTLSNGHRQVENGAPYALFGDNNGDYSGMILPPGLYTITAQAFTGPNLTGSSIGVITIELTIVNSDVSNAYIMPCSDIVTNAPSPSIDFCQARWLAECCGG